MLSLLNCLPHRLHGSLASSADAVITMRHTTALHSSLYVPKSLSQYMNRWP